MSITRTLLQLASLEFATEESAILAKQCIKEIVAHDKKQRERLKRLQALEAYGVDNWEGYDEAIRFLHDSNDNEDDC